MPDTSPSVLIVRLDAIGDALALTPLVAALRARGCGVGIVLRTVNAQVFAPGAFDRIHVEDGARALAAFGYTHALVATEDPRGYKLAAAARIPVRIGFDNGWGKPLKTLWVRRICTRTVRRTAGLDARAPHEAAVLYELGRSVLGPVAEPSRDPRVLRPLVMESDPPADSRVVLQVTDKWERLGAPLSGLTDLAARIAARHGLRAIAAARESPYADRFSAATGIPVERFTALSPWKAAIAAARVVVAPDSGALHVAGMTGTPTVALFAATPEFRLQSARWAPWAAPHRIVAMDGAWPTVAADAVGDLLSGRRRIYTG